MIWLATQPWHALAFRSGFFNCFLFLSVLKLNFSYQLLQLRRQPVIAVVGILELLTPISKN